MYTFKNRSNYAQKHNKANSVPTTWEHRILNRKIEWSIQEDGLHYTVSANRVNHNGYIVKPECSNVVLFQSIKRGVQEPSNDLLQALADAWAATVLLGDGEAYNGTNAHMEKPDTEQVLACSEGEYPYFES